MQPGAPPERPINQGFAADPAHAGRLRRLRQRHERRGALFG
jgi:hypothetical protein